MNTTEIQQDFQPVDDNMINVHKRSDIGVIPQDWSVEAISSVADVKTGPFGSALHERDYADDGTPIITVEHLSEHGIIHHNLPLVSDTDRSRLKSYGLRTGDIVFSRVGSVDRNSLVKKKEDGWLFSGRLLRVRTLDNTTYPPYLSYHFHSEPFKKRVRGVAVGQTMASLNTQILKAVYVVLPPLSEQRAIAEALSDVDGLLAALEELIAKKRAIKQAAMQQLLTGKTRLPGFSGEWETKRLGEFVSIRNHKILPSNVPLDTPCVELDHIEQGSGRLLGCSTAQHSTSSKYRFFVGDVLFGRLRSYLRKFWLSDRDGICTTEIWPLMTDPHQADSGFLHAIVQSDQFIEAASISYGTHMPRADWGVMQNFEVHLPQVKEQFALATVLSDMDAEIAALEQRRDKTRAVKQSMMQQLLTGRIRLVQPETTTEELAAARSAGRKHNWHFNEAVVISVLAKHFGNEQYPLGRMRYTKLSYLLHRHKEGHAEGYIKKAAGPYNPQTRYGGPEKIALQKDYVRQHRSGKGQGFIASTNFDEAESYFDRWYGSEVLQWLEQFRYKTNNDLELLTTVDMAVEELGEVEEEVSVESVKEVIRSNPEWKPKLDRSIFSDANLARAIESCQKLFDY